MIVAVVAFVLGFVAANLTGFDLVAWVKSKIPTKD